MIFRGIFLTLIAALIAAGLAGCASEDTAGRFLVEPDKYVLYSCTEIAATMQGNAARQRELEGLMAKAVSGTGGQFVSNVAYRPEYIQLRGEMNELRRSFAEKKCKPVPGAAPGGQASDQAVH